MMALGNFASSDVLLARFEQLLVGGIPALDELNDRDYLLAPALRRPSGDDDVVAAGMLGHRGLYFLGEDLLAARVDLP